MGRVAAIDCGTNSIRLLIADVDEDGRALTDIERTMQIVRLGEGVDATGRLSDAALQRTFAACDVYAAMVEQHGAQRVRFVATSATRDAANRDVFVDGVRARLGVEPEVISGTEEAALSFTGATLDAVDPGPYLVVDIGGGSTEFVLGDLSPDVSVSVDVGCVRMTERHLHSDPPTVAEIAAAERDIAAAVERAIAVVPVEIAASVVGVSGTVTTLSAMAMDLGHYDATRLHGSVLSAADVESVTARLLAMTGSQRAALPFMHPGRVDVIGGGALVVRSIVRRCGFAEVVVSETDILDGIVYRLASS